MKSFQFIAIFCLVLALYISREFDKFLIRNDVHVARESNISEIMLTPWYNV